MSLLYPIRVDVKITQRRIKPVQNLHDRSMVLEHEELQEHQIEDRQSEQDAPHGRMRTREWAVGKGQHRDDEKEECDAQHAGPDV